MIERNRRVINSTLIAVDIALLAAVFVVAVSAMFTPTPEEEPAPSTNPTVELIEVPELPEPEPPTVEPVPEPVDKWGMTAEELDIVKRVVSMEARGESYLGQMAVAQCIRETAEITGMTPYEVVTQKGQYADPYNSYTDSVSDAVQAVLYDGEDAVTEDIRFFYAPGRVYSKWHENNLEFVCEIGGHRFFKTKQ